MASDEPVDSSPSPWLARPWGAMRTASEGVMDQKMACEAAMPRRLAISTQYWLATAETPWLTMNTRKTPMSRRRRSILPVASISGSEPSATTQA